MKVNKREYLKKIPANGIHMIFETLLQNILAQYYKDTPHAVQITQGLQAEKEVIFLDHISFRTLNLNPIRLEKIADFFKDYGFVEKGVYHFPSKHLHAKHYEHPDTRLPKIFISELITEQCQPFLKKIFSQCIEDKITTIAPDIFMSQVPWAPLSFNTYQLLRTTSEYAAWFYIYGFRMNHITINVHSLKQYNSIAAINTFLKNYGIRMNSFGGLIKGTSKEHLVQSGTLAEALPISFIEGEYPIPAFYYGFSERHPLSNGKIYTGFVATSADRMFESTDYLHCG